MSVTRNPNIKNGRPIIQGSKISVLQILEMYEDDVDISRISSEFKDISLDDVVSALEYAEENSGDIQNMRDKSEEAKSKIEDIGSVYYLDEGHNDEMDRSGESKLV